MIASQPVFNRNTSRAPQPISESYQAPTGTWGGNIRTRMQDRQPPPSGAPLLLELAYASHDSRFSLS
jgi:hypothetical protein